MIIKGKQTKEGVVYGLPVEGLGNPFLLFIEPPKFEVGDWYQATVQIDGEDILEYKIYKIDKDIIQLEYRDIGSWRHK